jgi:hypothetical protein
MSVKGFIICGRSIGEEDFAGMIAGGIVGAAIGGTSTLGTAIVPSWFAGAITGAIGGSPQEAYQAIMKLFL